MKRKLSAILMVLVVFVCQAAVGFATEDSGVIMLSGTSDGYYEIGAIEFRNASNAVVAGISDGGKVSKVTLTKTQDETKPASVIVAIYESNGKLRTLGKAEIDGTELSGATINVPFNVSFGTSVSGLSIRVFVWNNMGNIEPLAGIYQLDGGQAMSIDISAVSGKTTLLTINASGISTFAGKTFTVTYDTTALSLADAVGVTKAAETAIGAVLNTDITITAVSSGSFSFTVNKTIPSGQKGGGLIDVVKFNALATGTSTVSVTFQ